MSERLANRLIRVDLVIFLFLESACCRTVKLHTLLLDVSNVLRWLEDNPSFCELWNVPSPPGATAQTPERGSEAVN